jgi:flagellar protein FlgJ
MLGASSVSASPGQLSSPAQMGHLRAQARELEGIFINTLMKEMFSSLNSDTDAMGGGFAEDTWRGLQAEEMSNAISEAGGIGLADAIMGDLLKIQEASRSSQFSNKGYKS